MTDVSPAGAVRAPSASATTAAPLTPHVALRRVVMLVNPMSGGVGAQAPEEARAILADYPLAATVEVLTAEGFDDQIASAFDARPDLVVVLAGDGTAGTIASRAGPDGPLVATLPGGTMNMLPKALYGTADWKAALRQALEQGEARPVAGGRLGEHVFYCAAILGSPALWAPAREAVRSGRLKLALAHARRALRRAFSGRIRFSLDGASLRRAEALVLISPVISKAMEAPVGLEAAAMNTADAAQAFRLAAHALFDDWRHDPSVSTRAARRIVIQARSRIPAVIDGEPTLLGHDASAVFMPCAFRALAPRPEPAAGGV